MLDWSWLWEKYGEPPPESLGAEGHLMRQDIFYLKGFIEGMLITLDKKDLKS